MACSRISSYLPIPATPLPPRRPLCSSASWARSPCLFVEYIGDFHLGGGPSNLLNFGGGYRVTPTQQVDFHIGIGLNDNAPAYIVGIGYSFRVDHLF